MKLLDRLSAAWSAMTADGPASRKKMYEGARSNRLMASWVASQLPSDEELRRDLGTLRARSRDLERQNPYARRFLSLLEINTVGPNGITLENEALMPDGEDYDDDANRRIEDLWNEWCEPGNCTVDGELSFREVQNCWIRSLARDGENVIRKYSGKVNDFNFALQPLEADHLDHTLNETSRSGNRIVLGIERLPLGKPVAYHLFQSHPGGGITSDPARIRLRIPADQVQHGFLKTRWSQTRGIPWMHAVMLRMRMLAKYEEAELVASLVSSAKMGFIETPTGEEFVGDTEEEDSKDQIIEAAEPGVMEQLPAGTKFSGWDPQHPTAAYGDFVKNGTKGVSSGLNVSYPSLGGDLADTNFSSMRYGSLEERDFYRMLQAMEDQQLCRPTFRAWLLMQLLNGRLPYEVSDFTRLYRPRFQLRGWDWVDPWRDVKSSIEAMQAGLSCLTIELEKRGYTVEQICQMIVREKRLMAKYGVSFQQIAQTLGGKAAEFTDPDLYEAALAQDDNRNNGHGLRALRRRGRRF